MLGGGPDRTCVTTSEIRVNFMVFKSFKGNCPMLFIMICEHMNVTASLQAENYIIG